MFDPFGQWRRYAAAGTSLQATGLRAARTAGGAGDVIAARSNLIGEAFRSPWTADHDELGRMMPEKLAAMTQAGSAASAIWLDIQSAWMKHMQHLCMMAMRGRPPTGPELVDLGERGASLVLRQVEAAAKLGSATLAPFSRQVSANVRRLDGSGAKARRRKL